MEISNYKDALQALNLFFQNPQHKLDDGTRRQMLASVEIIERRLDTLNDTIVKITSVNRDQKEQIFQVLHDGPVAKLIVGRSTFMQILENDVSAPSLSLTRAGLEFANVVQGEIDVIRNIIRKPLKAALDKTGYFIPQLQALRKQIISTYSVDNTNQLDIVTQYDPSSDFNDITSSFSELMIDFIRNTIVNAISHGIASSVHTNIIREGNVFTIKTTDNGSGFKDSGLIDVQDLFDSGGIGLYFLAKRAEKYDGDLEIMGQCEQGGAMVTLRLRFKG